MAVHSNLAGIPKKIWGGGVCAEMKTQDTGGAGGGVGVGVGKTASHWQYQKSAMSTFFVYPSSQLSQKWILYLSPRGHSPGGGGVGVGVGTGGGVGVGGIGVGVGGEGVGVGVGIGVGAGVGVGVGPSYLNVNVRESCNP